MDADEDKHVVRSRRLKEMVRSKLKLAKLTGPEESSLSDSAALVADMTEEGDSQPCSQLVPSWTEERTGTKTTGGSDSCPTKLESSVFGAFAQLQLLDGTRGKECEKLMEVSKVALLESGVSGGSTELQLPQCTTKKENEKAKEVLTEISKATLLESGVSGGPTELLQYTAEKENFKINEVSTVTLPEFHLGETSSCSLSAPRSLRSTTQLQHAQENTRNAGANGEEPMEVLTSRLPSPEISLSRKRSRPTDVTAAAHQEKGMTAVRKRTKSRLSALKQLQETSERRRKRRRSHSSSESDSSDSTDLDSEEDEERENIAEILCAASVGFPPYGLSKEEIEAGVVSSITNQECAYIQVRNHILSRWRSNVDSWLALDTVTVKGRLRDEYFGIAEVAYKFLSDFGYINFGVAPAIKLHIPRRATKARVIVIGAGLAGLAAARQLQIFGHDVVVLEARTRVGGRVFTKTMEGGGCFGAAELGGSVLTGIEGNPFDGTGLQGNPLAVIARQRRLHLQSINGRCPLYHGGLLVNAHMDEKVENQFNQLLDKADEWRKMSSRVSENLSLGCTLETLMADISMTATEKKILDWHYANLEFGNASLLSNLSLANWDQDDEYEIAGDHCLLEGGNVHLVNALAEGLQILYDTQVEEILYGGEKVAVTAGEKCFEGEFVLCTLPLGVLKQGRVKFQPKLPARKLGAIQRLGFGVLNKVAMLFTSAFWGEASDTFGHVANHTSIRGEYFLFYSYRNVGAARSPLLIALVAGEAAMSFEHHPPVRSAAKVLSILREIFEPQGVSVPDPVQVVCTRWGKDPFALGSYSSVAVGSSAEDYDILAESVRDRLFFAGEATTRFYPATMHGAFLSGLREAGNISRRAAGSSTSGGEDSESKSRLTNFAEIFKRPDLDLEFAEVFKNPDLEFGCFSVVFDSKHDDGSSSALVKVLLGREMNGDNLDVPLSHMRTLLMDQVKILTASEKACRSIHVVEGTAVHVYVTLTEQQVLELMEVRGGDTNRLKYLVRIMGVKLVGRNGFEG